MTAKYVFGLLLLLTYPFTGCSSARDSTTKPNVILIVVDDQGYGDLSCYPHLVTNGRLTVMGGCIDIENVKRN